MIAKDNGVTIGSKHTYKDYGLIMTSKVISSPEPQTKYVDVPSRNGSIDMTTVLTGNVRYKNRTLTMEFVSEASAEEWSLMQSELTNYIQGNLLQFIFDDDIAFYWLGRATVEVGNSGQYATVVISANVDPYKYNITTSAEEWLWDSFDFEQSIINETSDIVVSGSREVTITSSQKWTNPIIVSDTDGITVEFGGTTKTLKTGSQVMYDFIFVAGDNVLTFTGDGTVSVVYVGGSL